MGVSISTAGVAALLGIAAFGAGMAVAGYTAEMAKPYNEKAASGLLSGGDYWASLRGGIFGKQLGTTRVSRSGLAMLHEGESVFNPQLPISKPLQAGGKSGVVANINITNHIDHIHTEADENRLARKTAEYISGELTKMVG